jgi:hypothetical protein
LACKLFVWGTPTAAVPTKACSTVETRNVMEQTVPSGLVEASIVDKRSKVRSSSIALGAANLVVVLAIPVIGATFLVIGATSTAIPLVVAATSPGEPLVIATTLPISRVPECRGKVLMRMDFPVSFIEAKMVKYPFE